MTLPYLSRRFSSRLKKKWSQKAQKAHNNEYKVD